MCGSRRTAKLALAPHPPDLGQTQPVPMFKVAALAGRCAAV